jgi:hypothetical protein
MSRSPEDDPAYIEDRNGIDAVRASIISELGKVDVDLLPADPFDRRSFKEATTALHYMDAIIRAEWYLDRAFRDGGTAKSRGQEYGETVAREFDVREAAEERQSEERTAARIAMFDELEETILHGRQQADDPTARAESEERKREFKQKAALGRANVNKNSIALRGIVENLNNMWQYISDMSHRELRRNERRRSRHRMFRVGLLLGYAVLVVVIGVLFGDALNGTKFATLWAALIVAIVLWGIDRWLISPGLDRWRRSRELQELKNDVTARAANLGTIRQLQSSIDIMADDVGVARVELIDPSLMRLPFAGPPADC